MISKDGKVEVPYGWVESATHRQDDTRGESRWENGEVRRQGDAVVRVEGKSASFDAHKQDEIHRQNDARS